MPSLRNSHDDEQKFVVTLDRLSPFVPRAGVLLSAAE
jgi:hypothetical protein